MLVRLAKLRYRALVWTKSILQRLLPGRLWISLRSISPVRVSDLNVARVFAGEWQTARKNNAGLPPSTGLPAGINVIGYLRAAKGVSEAARGNLLALQAAKIPYSAIDYEVDVPLDQQTEVLAERLPREGFKFNTSLFHVNPPQLPFLWKSFKPSELTKHYHVGVWYWELPDFPDEWHFAFDLVDEVWAGSQFIFDGISAKSSVPVIKIPPCVDPVYDPRLKRSDYHLPDNRFLFLCAYDVLSSQVRKNPLGAVEAFKRAFAGNDSSVGLVLKINNAQENPDELRQLHNALKDNSNCYFIEQTMDRSKMNSLLNVIDVYVSLHRSEGFGLIPAEAMSLGKPVIMTRWSGNLDFMTDDNSCGVDYKLIPVGERSGPYLPGQSWADPDIDHASFFMKKLFSDKEYYARISAQAQKTIAINFSPLMVGQLIRERMLKIGLIS
jgi:glycosyltransferase involved in cell wall biosynthesis